MSRPKANEVSTPLSLFPFIGVLLSTMGALLVVLVAVSRSAHNSALRDVATQRAAAQNTPRSADDEQDQRKLQEVQQYMTRLEEIENRAQQLLRDDQLKLSHAEDHMRRLQDQLSSLKAAAIELETMDKDHLDDRRQAEREVARLNDLIKDTKQRIESLRDSTATKKRSFAIIPYEGRNGTRRRPVYIECKADEVILQPEAITLTDQDFARPVDSGNPLAAALRAIREQLVREAGGIAPSKQSEPYPLILIRPDGIGAYYAVREAIASWDADFGYEFVGDDWKLEFQPANPQLARVAQQAVEQARVRRKVLAAAAPRAFREGGFFGGDGDSDGDHDDDLADDGGGRYSGGSGQGGAGGFADGRGGLRGSAGGSADTRGAGGGAYAGLSPQSGVRGPGTGGYATAGAGSANAGIASPFGNGGATAGSTSTGGATSAVADERSTSRQAANSARGGAAATGQYAMGANAAGATNAAGGSRASASGSFGASGTGSFGAKPGGKSGTSGQLTGAGGSPGGSAGPAGGSGGVTGGSLVGSTEGPAGGDGNGPGGPLPYSSSTPSGTVGSTAGGYSGGGTGEGGAGGGNPSAAALAGSDGQPGQIGSSAMAGATPGLPPSQPHAMPERITPQELAQQRGPNWALAGKGAAAVPVRRSIQAVVRRDRISLLPDSGNPADTGHEIQINGPMSPHVDEIVGAVQTHINAWGIAGNGLYWRPVLVLNVGPDGTTAPLNWPRP